MPNIRPVSDLRNHFAEIAHEVQANHEPVFLTKNGVGSMVVMSMEAYENQRYESEVYNKLMEAELQARTSERRLAHREVRDEIEEKLSRYGVTLHV